MDDQDFPIDDSTRVITFPCFILSNESGSGFVCSDLQNSSGVAVALLTDPDALARYRQDMGLQDRDAHQFNTGRELLEALDDMPPAVTHLVLDPLGLGSRDHRVLEIGCFKDRLRAQVG